jgi:transmembrane protein TMEM260 (protein O-mannosyltransferase)
LVVSLLLYSSTLAPTVTLVDSGELIVAARFLGVPHPPGFPLYVILAYLASLVPIGNIAQRIHFASALFAALGAAVVTLVVAELIVIQEYLKAQRQAKKKGRKAQTGAAAVSPSFTTLAPALTAGLAVAFSRTLWSYATIAEVYTLNTLLIVTTFWLMVRWRRKILEDGRLTRAARAPFNCQHDWSLYCAAAVFGLALGVHHVTVALTLPAFGLLVWATQGPRFFTSKRLLYAAAFAFAALIIIYSYLPISASRASIINWGNPRSFQAVWAHISGKQYQVFLSFDSKIIGNELVEFAKLLLREFGPWWLPVAPVLMVTGFVRLFRRDRVIFWFLAILVITNLAYGLSYFIAEDKDAYYLPAFIALAVATVFGLQSLLEVSFLKQQQTRLKRLTVATLVLLVPAFALTANWPFNNRRHYFIAHDYAENILRSAEPNGLLLTLDWQVASPMLYTREIEHLRPDVKVIDVNLLRRLWYFGYLEHAYPEMMNRSRDKVETFVEELRRWDNNPKAYANDASLTRRIASKFQEMLVAFITTEIKIAPVYTTNDILFQKDQQDGELTQWLTKQYQFVPHGLIFKLEEDRSFHDPGPLHLVTRGLADGTIRFDPDDVVSLKVLPAYKTMLVNRGRYFSFFDLPARAREAFASALALDSTLDPAREGLKDSLTKVPRSR